jgi:hypothetical protein
MAPDEYGKWAFRVTMLPNSRDCTVFSARRHGIRHSTQQKSEAVYTCESATMAVLAQQAPLHNIHTLHTN